MFKASWIKPDTLISLKISLAILYKKNIIKLLAIFLSNCKFSFFKPHFSCARYLISYCHYVDSYINCERYVRYIVRDTQLVIVNM